MASYEKIRAEVAKKYNQELSTLRSENKKLISENEQLLKENDCLKAELESTKDWVERLQDYCNMSEEDRRRIVENEKISSTANSALHILACGLGKGYLNGLF